MPRGPGWSFIEDLVSKEQKSVCGRGDKLSTVAHACNPSTWEPEQEDEEKFKGQHELQINIRRRN